MVTRIDRLARSMKDLEVIVAARRRGVYRGRPPTIDMEEVRAKIAEGQSPTRIAREMGNSRGTVYKAKALMSPTQSSPFSRPPSNPYRKGCCCCPVGSWATERTPLLRPRHGALRPPERSPVDVYSLKRLQ